jgi:hypothetical protein
MKICTKSHSLLSAGLLFFLSFATHAESISKTVCEGIAKQEKPSAFIVHNGRLLSHGEPVNLGDLESRSGEPDVLPKGDYYLILTPKKYTTSITGASNTLSIELIDMPASCRNTTQYKIKLGVAPKNFGPGKFTEGFSLTFYGPGNYGYPAVVNTEFDTHIVGVIHGPGAVIELNKDIARDFFSGKIPVFDFVIKNAGDRNLKLSNLFSDMAENPKEIKLKRTNCVDKDVQPAASCKVELEWRSRPVRFEHPVSYAFAVKSNDVGAIEGTEFHLEYEGGDVRSYVRFW